MSFLKEKRNIKWLIGISICLVLVVVSIDIVITGDTEIKKFLLIEIFSVVSVLTGYYWGSSKDSENNIK